VTTCRKSGVSGDNVGCCAGLLYYRKRGTILVAKFQGGVQEYMKAIRKMRRDEKGFTLIEIMIVVLIIGILLAIAVPNFVKARETSRTKSCISNLKQLDAAKEQWAMDNKKTTGDEPTMANLVGSDNYIKMEPSCPSGGAYTINVIGTNPACSLAASGHTLTPEAPAAE
jgi:prepilin-type N-terminal cleavage/methylation domain-containing protein